MITRITDRLLTYLFVVGELTFSINRHTNESGTYWCPCFFEIYNEEGKVIYKHLGFDFLDDPICGYPPFPHRYWDVIGEILAKN